MRAFKRQSRAVLVVLASAIATAFFALPASPASAVAFTNACNNNITSANTQFNVDLAGTSPAQVNPGESFTLSNLSQSVEVPAGVFLNGYRAFVLNVGENTLNGDMTAVIEGTHTVEGAQTTSQGNFTVTTTITDPTPGNRNSGDESATPDTASVTYPDQTWTAGPTGALIEFREDTVQPLVTAPRPDGSGGVIVHVSVGPIQVFFACSPGTVDEAASPTGVIAFTDPAPAFATTEVLGPPETTITKGPKDKTKLKKKKKKAKATFEFTSSEPGSSFECSVDNKAFAPCTSPHTVKVKKGKHTFEVRARDRTGETDPTPATDSWKVKRKKK